MKQSFLKPLNCCWWLAQYIKLNQKCVLCFPHGGRGQLMCVDLFKDIISEERALQNQRMFISLLYGILNRGLDDASVSFL